MRGVALLLVPVALVLLVLLAAGRVIANHVARVVMFDVAIVMSKFLRAIAPVFDFLVALLMLLSILVERDLSMVRGRDLRIGRHSSRDHCANDAWGSECRER